MALPDALAKSMRDTLFAGGYSLLLGAGASFDSRNSKGNLPLGDTLRQNLVALKNLRSGSPLSRAYGALTQGEIDTHITDRFVDCVPGPTVLKVPIFNWRRIYTLNIDDALEAAYRANPGHQVPDSLTHLSAYMEASDVDTVQIAHIHGWAGKPDDGYVFSLSEYAGAMAPSSAWTSVLAQTIASEPFIIAGTSLEEPDLEYFLTGRHSTGIRKDRGPSFLIEPNPDTATENDCERHGLHLYAGTFLEFLNELEATFPSRPLPANATSELSKDLFRTLPTTRDLARFARDFAYVVARQGNEDADLGFFVGRKPTPNDIALGRDIARASTLALKAEIRRRASIERVVSSFFILDDNAGTGKTTILARSVFDLAGEGYHIFEYRSRSTPNLDVAASIFNSFGERFIIFVDDLADHVAAFVELHKRLQRADYLIVGAERSYRMHYIMQTLQGITFDRYTLGRFTPDEARDLIRRMEDLGLTSSGDLARNSGDIAKDPIAIAVCRVMQDFRAVEDIVHSLIGDSDELRIRRYAACALAAYCYRIGLASSVLSAAFDNVDLSQQLQERDRLPLAFSDFDTRDYIIPTNPVLGERILREVAKSDSALMFEVYCAVGAYLAPYVNRQAIRRRTPEARIAQRLFDYDDVVSELIPNQSESLYLSMKRYWDWNSRYWEQFALLKVDKFLKSTDQNRFDLLAQAISHARHAVKIERHSFGLTTLGRILLVQMRHITGGFERPFREAFGYLEEAIRQEGRNNRIAIHPYMALFGGVGGYIDRGGVLSPRELDAINQHTAQADVLFPYDRQLLEVVRDLRAKVVDQKK